MFFYRYLVARVINNENYDNLKINSYKNYLIKGELYMGYEIDFIGVKNQQSKKDADAIVIRWKENDNFKIAIFDGGFQSHGEEMMKHLNQYCFSGESEKIIDCVFISHPDQDHTSGLKEILNNFNVKALYMNRPWLYVNELYDKRSDLRITEKSLDKRLKEQYPYIAALEDLAIENNIPIYEAFQGYLIENRFKILSPTKDFYLNLILESYKTPLVSENTARHGLIAGVIRNLIESWTIEELREDVETSAENEMSTVIFGYMPVGEDEEHILLTGDVGKRGLNEALDYAETIEISVNKDIKFYQIPHHGGRRNLTPSIMNRMVGNIVNENHFDGRIAFASSSEGSDHPLQMIVNAYTRRGVKVYSNNNGTTIHHSNGDMPKRIGWHKLQEMKFNENVENWE